MGKYQVLKPLQTGGMAELYLARAQGIEGFAKLVALKRVRPELAHDADLVRMFLDEARVMATLNHGNIVQVYDIGSVDGSYFFTMEFLHGVDLRAIFKAGRAGGGVPLEQSLHIASCTLAALHYAHERAAPDGSPLNLVHRDVSPANIFVTYEGEVKLLDFGIAKAANQSTQTRSGTMKGKLRYMAPEQVKGAPVDRRCDVFALSIVLWELTTGRRLFAGASEFETISRIVGGEVPKPTDISPDYPPDLEQVVMKGLAVDPDERWPTARAMQLALQQVAVERRLACSSLSLSEYVSGLFKADIEAWKAARLEGRDLAEHVSHSLDMHPSRGTMTSGSFSAVGATARGPHDLPEAATAPPPSDRRPRQRVSAVVAIGAAVAAGGLALGVWTARRPAAEANPVDASAPVAAPSQTVAEARPSAAAPAASAPPTASASVAASTSASAPGPSASAPLARLDGGRGPRAPRAAQSSGPSAARPAQKKDIDALDP